MMRHLYASLICACVALANFPAAANVNGPASAATAELYVRAIQEELAAQGFYKGAIDGQAGPATKWAIRAWQRAAGLDVDGTAGPALLNALRFGPKQAAPAVVFDPDVRRVQEGLAALGLYQGTIDGINGAATRAALSQFQISRGLAADGQVTPELLDLIAGAPALQEACGPATLGGVPALEGAGTCGKANIGTPATTGARPASQSESTATVPADRPHGGDLTVSTRGATTSPTSTGEADIDGANGVDRAAMPVTPATPPPPNSNSLTLGVE